MQEALDAAHELGYPVLLRPSYVIGGQNMVIAHNDEDVRTYMEVILSGKIENPVLVDQYLMGKELEVDAIDLIPEALEFANMGLLPAGMYRNRAFAEVGVDAGETALCRQDLLYDPQTAGGLLMAVDPADAEALYRELQGCVPSAQRIGVVKAYRGGKRIFLR